MSAARDTLAELEIPCEVRVVSAHRMPDEMFEYAATAYSLGRFVFDRVVPGSLMLARRIDLSDHSFSSSHTTRIDVKPDHTTPVALGGSGRPVIGRVVVPEGFRQSVDWGYSLNRLSPKPSMLTRVMGRLGLAKDGPAPAIDYAVKVELDHVVPLDLGGAPLHGRNFALQPRAGACNAHQKATLERQLSTWSAPATLNGAQHEIATDWRAAYKKWIDGKGCREP